MVWSTIVVLWFMGHDEDFKQGNCEEGFYQHNDGNDGDFCAPMNHTGSGDSSLSVSNQQIGWNTIGLEMLVMSELERVNN